MSAEAIFVLAHEVSNTMFNKVTISFLFWLFTTNSLQHRQEEDIEESSNEEESKKRPVKASKKKKKKPVSEDEQSLDEDEVFPSGWGNIRR